MKIKLLISSIIIVICCVGGNALAANPTLYKTIHDPYTRAPENSSTCVFTMNSEALYGGYLPYFRLFIPPGAITYNLLIQERGKQMAMSHHKTPPVKPLPSGYTEITPPYSLAQLEADDMLSTEGLQGDMDISRDSFADPYLPVSRCGWMYVKVGGGVYFDPYYHKFSVVVDTITYNQWWDKSGSNVNGSINWDKDVESVEKYVVNGPTPTPTPTPIPTQIPLTLVPSTGQTKCYNETVEIECPKAGEPFYGQDGNFKNINPMSYIKLDANGKALPDSATDWKMVKDNVTGLIWEKKTPSDGNPKYYEPNNADNVYSWYDQSALDVNEFLKSLNDNVVENKWRLPEIYELASIILYEATKAPYINPVYFSDTKYSNTQSPYYWTSTKYSSKEILEKAWAVNFGFNEKIFCNFSDTSDQFAVRAVKGGQSGFVPSKFVESDTTITDISNGLMWEKSPKSDSMSWQDALKRCANLSTTDNGWRLPTIKELQSLVDYSKNNPAIDSRFVNTISENYWTSTTVDDRVENAWSVNFENGLPKQLEKTQTAKTRAVRSTKTSCTATAYYGVDGVLLLHIPYITTDNVKYFSNDMIYYPIASDIRIFFKWDWNDTVDVSNIQSCEPTKMTNSYRTITIPEVIIFGETKGFPITLEYDAILSNKEGVALYHVIM